MIDEIVLLKEKEKLKALIQPAVFQFITTTGTMPEIDIYHKIVSEKTKCGEVVTQDDINVTIKAVL